MEFDSERRKAFEQLEQNYLRELFELVEVCEAEADWELAVACYQKIFLWESEGVFTPTKNQNILSEYQKQSIQYLHLAQKFQQQRKLDLAVAAYRKAIAIKPEQPAWVYQSLGNLYQQLSQPEAAIEVYQKAIALEPEQPAWVYQSLGNLYQQLSQSEAAIEVYQKAIALEPEQPVWVYRSLGNLYYLQERSEAAIEAYQKAIAIEPEQSAIFYQRLGNLFQQQQQLDSAITAYRQAIEIESAVAANVYVKIGDILERQNKPFEAKAAYELAATELSNHNCDRILAFLGEYFPGDGLFNLDLFDNGCEPTGRQLSLLADKIDGRVIGTNIGKDFPEKSVCHRRDNTEFYWMDGQKLTFSDNSFDVVLSLNVLEHVPHPELYLQECYRVMRSGGYGYFSWYPLWSGATGHHMHPGMMSGKAKNLGIVAPEDYDLDGKTIPFWGHLLLSETEMLSLLTEEKQYPVALAEWMVHYIYHIPDINRCFWQDVLNVFNNLPWKIIEIDPKRQIVPQQTLEQLQTKYGTSNDFQVKGATIIVYKN
jgi:tetratricopeptide (TPR) repeat protein